MAEAKPNQNTEAEPQWVIDSRENGRHMIFFGLGMAATIALISNLGSVFWIVFFLIIGFAYSYWGYQRIETQRRWDEALGDEVPKHPFLYHKHVVALTWMATILICSL